MAFIPIVVKREKVKVVTSFTDIDGTEYVEFFDAYRISDKCFLSFYETEAIIETLKPSKKYPGFYESEAEIVEIADGSKAKSLITDFEHLTASDFIDYLAEATR